MRDEREFKSLKFAGILRLRKFKDKCFIFDYLPA